MNFERCTCPWTQLSFNMGEMCLSIVLKPWSSYKLFFGFFLAWFSVSYMNCWLTRGLSAECVLPSSSHCWAGISVHKDCPVHAAWHSLSASSGREPRLAAAEPFGVGNSSTAPHASPMGIFPPPEKHCLYLFKNNLSIGVFVAIEAIHFQAYFKLDIRAFVCTCKRHPKSSGIHSWANAVQLHFSLYPCTLLLKLVWGLKYQFNSAELISNC